MPVMGGFDPATPAARAFLAAFDRSQQKGEGADRERHERRRRYERDASQGQAERFSWYKALPPGGKPGDISS